MTSAPASLWFRSALLDGNWASGVRIRHDGGRIVEVRAGAAPDAADERHDIGLPGLPNLHSHAFQRAMAGLTETAGQGPDSFWTWREVMYRFVQAMTPEDVEAIAAFAFAQMLQTGFTRVGEFHYLHHGPDGRPYADVGELSARIVAAARTAGIGLTLLPVFYRHGGFGGAPASEAQRRFLNDLDRYARLHQAAKDAAAPYAGARVGAAPHSLRAVAPQELEQIAALAGDGPIHIHIAEQMREVDDCIAWSGRRPVEWLLDHAAVDARWCLVHATHMSEAETSRLAASGAAAGLCPITEANLGDGVFPGAAFAKAGGRFGVGSDSNVRIDAAGELRLLEYSQRLALRQRNVMAGGPGQSTGGALFRAALDGGGRALGDPSPALAVGRPLDLMSLDATAPSLIGREGDALIDGWIFAGAAVDCVWVGGRKRVAQGRHVGMDAIARDYRRSLTRLLGA